MNSMIDSPLLLGTHGDEESAGTGLLQQDGHDELYYEGFHQHRRCSLCDICTLVVLFVTGVGGLALLAFLQCQEVELPTMLRPLVLTTTCFNLVLAIFYGAFIEHRSWFLGLSASAKRKGWCIVFWSSFALCWLESYCAGESGVAKKTLLHSLLTLGQALIVCAR